MYRDEEQGCIFIDIAAAQVYSHEQKTDFGSVAAFREEKVIRLRKPQREAQLYLPFLMGGGTTNRKEGLE